MNLIAGKRTVLLTLIVVAAAAFAVPALAQTPAPSGAQLQAACIYTNLPSSTNLVACKCNIPAGKSCEIYCKERNNSVCIEVAKPECQVQCSQQNAAAATAEPLRTRGLSNPLQTGTIPELIGRVIQIFTGVVGSLALLMFIYGSMLWVTSRGNSEQIEKGKQIFVWSTIGLVIIFSAYLILRVLFQTIGATA